MPSNGEHLPIDLDRRSEPSRNFKNSKITRSTRGAFPSDGARRGRIGSTERLFMQEDKMGTDLALIEPLKLPDRRRPAQIPSLPEWVVSRLESLKDNWQNGSMALTLPEAMVLSEAEKSMVLRHVADLGTLVEKTPANSADAEAETLVIVTKMLLALPGQRSTDTGNEAKGEAYLAALDDVPPWAVQEAVRKWYRGEHGPKFDYRWSPVPADLRSLARSEEFKIRGRMTVLERVCKAVPLIEFSDEHRQDMLNRLSGLIKTAANPQLLANSQAAE